MLVLHLCCEMVVSQHVVDTRIPDNAEQVPLQSYNIQNYSCRPSVCLSVMGGQRKRFDLKIQEAVYLAIER